MKCFSRFSPTCCSSLKPGFHSQTQSDKWQGHHSRSPNMDAGVPVDQFTTVHLEKVRMLNDGEARHSFSFSPKIILFFSSSKSRGLAKCGTHLCTGHVNHFHHYGSQFLCVIVYVDDSYCVGTQ